MNTWDVNTWNVTVTGPAAMPFGKHKGKTLDQVPRDYLEWAVHNAEMMRPELRAEIEKILGLLPGSTGPPPGKPSQVKPDESMDQNDRSQLAMVKKAWAADQRRLKALEAEIKDLRAALDFEKREKVSGMDMFRRVVKQVFAGLSRKHHPDAGGSVERQMVVNDFYRELIGRMDHGNGIS